MILRLQRQSEIRGKVCKIYSRYDIYCPLAVDREIPSLFSQTQTNLFENTAFEASNDDFQEAPLLIKGKDNIY
jgi:hypothetical protein